MLGDILDINYLSNVYKGSWKTTVLSFISTTQPPNEFSDSYINNSFLGYNDELEKLGNAVLIDSNTDVINEPYSSKLRPLDDISFLKRAKNVTFINFTISCFDTTKHGSIHQNATANNILKNSYNTDSPYAQTNFNNTIPVTWLRNYFNPIVKVNGLNILNSNSHNYFETDNKGDKSIGMMLPKKFYLYHTVKQLDSLEIFGSVRQILTANNIDYYAKAYPIKFEVVITYSS